MKTTKSVSQRAVMCRPRLELSTAQIKIWSVIATIQQSALFVGGYISNCIPSLIIKDKLMSGGGGGHPLA
jgi:hypothetical protein